MAPTGSPAITRPTLSVVAWIDPLVDRFGHDARSRYVETYWLGILGPSTTWLLRHLADRLDAEPSGFTLDVGHCGTCLGLSAKGGRHSPMAKALARMVGFGGATLQPGGTMAVRRRLPPLTRRQLERLPEALRARHAHEHADHSDQVLLASRRRARAVAQALLAAGESVGEVERVLGAMRLHPAVAAAAVAAALGALTGGVVPSSTRATVGTQLAPAG